MCVELRSNISFLRKRVKLEPKGCTCLALRITNPMMLWVVGDNAWASQRRLLERLSLRTPQSSTTTLSLSFLLKKIKR